MTEREKELLQIIEELRERVSYLQSKVNPPSKHTNFMIKAKYLRRAYAVELWQWRKWRRGVSAEEWNSFRLGLESGFWAMQKAAVGNE